MNITLIGTGLIGFNIAKRLCEFNNEIYVYNRTKEKALPLENYGAKVLDNLSDIDSDFIIGVLTDYSSYLDIFDKMTNLKNKTFIQMGTISSNENLELEKICKSMNCDYIEAPVLGSKKEAESGTLLIMSSGKENVYNKCKPIFEQISEKNLFVGDIGKASNLKLALNQLIASLSSAFSLSLGIVQKSEIDINIFMDILRSSSFYAPTFDKKLSNMINKDFENPNFPTKHLLKDVDLILDISKDFELKTNALEGVKSNIEKAIEIGLSDKDYSSVFMAIFNENI